MHLLNKIVIALLLLGPLKAHGGEATRYADQLNTYLTAITTLSAGFEQTTTDQTAYNTAYDTAYDAREYNGRLWMEKPNRFRVDTINPSLQTVVSDGIDFWSYDEDLEQVVISQLNEDLNQVPILLFSSDILSIQKAYNISGYTGESDNHVLLEHFVLEPMSDLSLFHSLTLSFHLGKPVSIAINATTGQITTVSLRDVTLNSAISPDRFNFIAPAGADVIDDRK
jgi:outer membrane lipoprotein carrier protein